MALSQTEEIGTGPVRQKADGTYDAAHPEFGSTSDSDETRIQNAINQAAADAGVDKVFVPDSLLPYDASSVTFDNSVRMVREGQQVHVWDVKAYGAAGDNVTDDTASFDAAWSGANSAGGGVVYVPFGNYRTDFFQARSNVTFQGDGRGVSVIRPVSGASGGRLLGGSGNLSGVTVKDIGFVNDSTDTGMELIRFREVNSGNLIEDVEITRCRFESTQVHSHLIMLGSRIREARVHDNRFIGYDGAQSGNSTACIWFLGEDDKSLSQHPNWVYNNRFTGSDQAVRMSTWGPGPLYVQDNDISGFKEHAINLHNPLGWVVTGNTIHNGDAPSKSNNDGAACWLDDGTSALADQLPHVFAENTVRDISGNGVYLETSKEMRVTDNTIMRCTARSSDTYTFTGQIENATSDQTYTSDGGIGLLITGAIREATISGNKIEQNEWGVTLARAFGVHTEADIEDLQLLDNRISYNEKWGVRVYGPAIGLKLSDNWFISNGEAAAATYGAILLDRESSENNFLEQFTIQGNTFKPGNFGSEQQHYAVRSTYSMAGARLVFQDNPVVEVGGTWIDATGWGVAMIQGNLFRGSASMNVAAANEFIRDNRGYRTENSGQADIGGASGTTVSVNHGLDVEPRPEHIMVTFDQNPGDVWWVGTVDATSFEVNILTDPGSERRFNWRIAPTP